MAYYISVVYNFEILQMRGEFLVDDNEIPWLTNCHDIKARPKAGYGESRDMIEGISVCVKKGQSNIFEKITPI